MWVGYDSRQSLGEKETGAEAALPIWMDFMKAAIAGKDDEQFPGDEAAPAMLEAKGTPPVSAQAVSGKRSVSFVPPSIAVKKQ